MVIGMKIYTKKEGFSLNNPFGTFLASLMILCFPVFIIVITFFTHSADYTKLMETYDIGIFKAYIYCNAGTIPFIIYFILCNIYLFILAFKKPRTFIGQLLKKEVDDGGYCYMYFKVDDYELKYFNKVKDVICYTKEDNNFIANKKYYITIKELYGDVKAIEEINPSSLKEENQSIFATIITDPLNFALIPGAITLLSNIVICILAMYMFPEYILYYMFFEIFCFAFCSMIFYSIFKRLKYRKK